MMNEEEKQPVDISKQPIVFGVCISFSCFLLLFFKSDVLRTIIFSYLFFFCLFLKTNRGRFMLCLVFIINFCKTVVWVKHYRFLLLYFAMILCSEFLFLFLC